MNYYQILGVDENASQDEIKKAYNNMIKAFHPDYYRGSNKEFAEEKTKELNKAYEVLKDPGSRAGYDRYLKSISDKSSPSSDAKSEPAEDVHRYDEVYAKINDMAEAECFRTCYTSFPEDISGAICTVAYKAICDIYSRKNQVVNYSAEWLRDYVMTQGMPDDMCERYMTAFSSVFLPERISRSGAFTWDLRGLSGKELDISLMARAVGSFRSVGLDINDKIEELETRESLERLVSGKFDIFNILENAINELYKFYVAAYNKTDWPAVREPVKPKEEPKTQEHAASPTATAATSPSEKPHSYAGGLFGAFLFALGGGLIWGILYYFGYLSAIGGIATIALAGLGYQKFGHVDYLTKPQKIVCFVIPVIVSALAVYLSTGCYLHHMYVEQFSTGEVDFVPNIFDIWMYYLPYFFQTSTETLNGYLLDVAKGLGLSAIYLIGWFITE